MVEKKGVQGQVKVTVGITFPDAIYTGNPRWTPPAGLNGLYKLGIRLTVRIGRIRPADLVIKMFIHGGVGI